MNTESFKPLDLRQGKHIGVTVPVLWLAGLFVLGTIFKPWVADYFGFVTLARAAEVENKVDELALTVNMDIATRMIERYETKIERLNDTPVSNRGVEWRDEQRKATARLVLANQYRDCIFDKREHCDQIQRQLWR